MKQCEVILSLEFIADMIHRVWLVLFYFFILLEMTSLFSVPVWSERTVEGHLLCVIMHTSTQTCTHTPIIIIIIIRASTTQKGDVWNWRRKSKQGSQRKISRVRINMYVFAHFSCSVWKCKYQEYEPEYQCKCCLVMLLVFLTLSYIYLIAINNFS